MIGDSGNPDGGQLPARIHRMRARAKGCRKTSSLKIKLGFEKASGAAENAAPQ